MHTSFKKIKSKNIILLLTFIVYFSFTPPAYAYLDPGSGSALFTGIIAIITAGFYSIKILYYKLMGKSISSLKAGDNTLVIFSEGKSYWGTFKPIVNELIQRKIPFRYISLDVFDPGLEIESEYMHSKLYSKSTTGFVKIATIKTPLMLSTTPNIGSEGYPLPRPKNVKELVHVFHDFVAGVNYRLGALDFYDTVITTGEYAEAYVRTVEKMRVTKQKDILPLGLPYLDSLYENLDHREKKSDLHSEQKTILIAPSWGNKGCFNYYGTEFVKDLHEHNYNIIVRLHPHSHIFEPENVAKWQNQLSNLKNLIWDTELYSTHSMQEADILISDTSSVRFDFAFLHLKPVITLDIPQEARNDFETIYHETTWDVKVAPSLGAVIQKSDISHLSKTLDQVLSTFNANILEQIRDENIANFGHSAEHIVSFMEERLKQTQDNI